MLDILILNNFYFYFKIKKAHKW